MDNYPHVKARFQAAGREPLKYSFHAPLASRMEMARFFPGAEICGEPGMECTGCVSERDLRTLGIEPLKSLGGFQRPECKCLAVKRELSETQRSMREQMFVLLLEMKGGMRI